MLNLCTSDCFDFVALATGHHQPKIFFLCKRLSRLGAFHARKGALIFAEMHSLSFAFFLLASRGALAQELNATTAAPLAASTVSGVTVISVVFAVAVCFGLAIVWATLKVVRTVAPATEGQTNQHRQPQPDDDTAARVEKSKWKAMVDGLGAAGTGRCLTMVAIDIDPMLVDADYTVSVLKQEERGRVDLHLEWWDAMAAMGHAFHEALAAAPQDATSRALDVLAAEEEAQRAGHEECESRAAQALLDMERDSWNAAMLRQLARPALRHREVL